MIELMHVPTVLELAAQGLARPVRIASGVAYTIDVEGQTRIYDAMRHNAKIGQLEDEERQANTARERYIWELHNAATMRGPGRNVS